MRILLPTGSATEKIVTEAAKYCDADVVVTGKLASFLKPSQLLDLLKKKDRYDCVIISGMCTASFREVEEISGVPIYKGPRHAADLSLILPYLDRIELSHDIPADEFLVKERQDKAMRKVTEQEEMAVPVFKIRDVKIGGDSRIKVIAEIMDAHHRPDIREVVMHYFKNGADIVDLGFGFDATPGQVHSLLEELIDIPGPIAVDTQDPDLIEVSLMRADLILSIHQGNMASVAQKIRSADCAAVVIPGEGKLEDAVTLAKDAGIRKLIADPVLYPAGAGLVKSLCRFREYGIPLFFGAGNVIELLDADSVGMTGLLAAMAHETGASVIFCSEHSDKTWGCIAEMRRATEMMYLMRDHPYPKDLGIDLLRIKEKRRRREPPLTYNTIQDAEPMPDEITYDPQGNFRIGIEDEYIIAVRGGYAVRGRRWQDIIYTLLKEEGISLLDHAAYLGSELFKAELALRYGRSYEQDGPF